MIIADFRNIRIHIEKEVHKIYEELVSRSAKDAEDHPFSTMKDVFMTSAVFGVKNNKWEKLKSSHDIFSVETFDQKIDLPVIVALAYRRTKNLEILSDAKKVIEIAQEWANAGIHLLQNELISRRGIRPLYKLVDLVVEEN